MLKRQAVFFAALFLGCWAAYRALDWWTAERPVDDFRDSVASVPELPSSPRPIILAGGIGGMPLGVAYSLPPAPKRLAKR